MAAGRPTEQSSTYFVHKSDYAVDGDYEYSMSQTAGEANPWWQVTLDRDYIIDRVVIQTRKDCCCAILFHLFFLFVLNRHASALNILYNMFEQHHPYVVFSVFFGKNIVFYSHAIINLTI